MNSSLKLPFHTFAHINDSFRCRYHFQLHWKYKTLIESTPLIDFDDMRAKQRRKKFHTSRGLIPPTQRRARLLEFGFSIEEIDDAKLRLQYSVGRCCCQFK
jgi:hypothetical protein